MYEQVNDPQLPQEGTHHESPIVEKDASKEQSAIEKDKMRFVNKSLRRRIISLTRWHSCSRRSQMKNERN